MVRVVVRCMVMRLMVRVSVNVSVRGLPTVPVAMARYLVMCRWPAMIEVELGV